jgi:hypothetical protein
MVSVEAALLLPDNATDAGETLQVGGGTPAPWIAHVNVTVPVNELPAGPIWIVSVRLRPG